MQPTTNDILSWNGTKGVYINPPPTDNRLQFLARKWNADTLSNIPAIPIAVSNTYIGLAPAGEAVTITNYDILTTVPTLGGLNGVTGIWTVPTTGWYLNKISINIRANNTLSNNGVETGDFGTGCMQFAILPPTATLTQCLLFRREMTVLGAGSTAGMSSTSVGRTGFINITEEGIHYLTEGATYVFKILNNTQLAYTPEIVAGGPHQVMYWQVIKLD